MYSVFIFVMSHLGNPPTPKFDLDWGDKVTHAGAYGLMMYFTFRAVAWIYPQKSFAQWLWIAAAYCLVYGATDELHQALIPNRECDLLDWVADATGTLLAAGVIAALAGTSGARYLFGRRAIRAAD